MDEKDFKDKKLLDQLKEYVTTRLELFRIDFIEKSSAVISTLITGLIISVFSLFILIFSSIGLALFLGTLVSSTSGGFFIVAGIFLLIVIILALGRKVFFETPLINYQIKKHFRK